MKIALVGYGKMGRMIESVITDTDHEIVARIDIRDVISIETLGGADVAIEFSTPGAAMGNLTKLAEVGCDTVCGTTGWYDRLGEASAAFARTGKGLIYSPNFSVGVQAFIRIAREASRLLSDQDAYESWAYEIHHSKKLDAPSGTLIKIVEEMVAAGYNRTIDVSSNRAGSIPGTHEIGFDSSADTITIRHSARSREGFAKGAVRAAEWIHGKSGTYEFGEALFG